MKTGYASTIAPIEVATKKAEERSKELRTLRA